MYRKFGKRLLDILGAIIIIILISPIMMILSIMILIFLGEPIIFTQERPGKGEKIFKMYKFRSMKDMRNSSGELLPDSERLTKFGRILRSTSLDELPELFNILKGDMSFVGPRPLLEEYLSYYTQEEKMRHDVLPGLTIPDVLFKQLYHSWDEQLNNDVWYINHYSFVVDCKILVATFGKLIARNKHQYGGYVRQKLSEERKK